MLRINAAFRDHMIAHARSALPAESCGLLAGGVSGEEKTVEEIYCLSNTDKSAEHFSMAPEEQFAAIADMRKKGYVLLGNFHSHPSTPARPSAEDIRLAFDPSLSYVILSLMDREPEIKSFSIRGGTAAEEIIVFQNGSGFSGV